MTPRILRSLAERIYSASRWLVPLVAVPRIAAALWRTRRRIAGADVVVVYEGGGFGHLICAPDIVRRLFPGRSVVMLFGAFPGEDNWRVEELWIEPRVTLLPFSIALPKSLPWKSLRVPLGFQMAVCRSLTWVLRRLLPDKTILFSTDDVFGLLWQEAPRLGIEILAQRTSDLVEWALPYYHLMRRRPAPPIRLPARIGDDIRRRLATNAGRAAPVGLCCLYLRKRGAEVEVETSSRSGSEPMEFTAAIRRLVAAGYQCLWIGDRALPGELRAMFAEWLFDAATLDVDAGRFSLFAATEADLFIGESGGGSFPPGINGIPALTVNHFPYYASWLHATAFPKFCYDAAGRVIPPEIMFGANSHLYAIPGATVRSNTAEELELAVVEFIRQHRRGIPYGVAVEEIVGTPNSLWYADAESRISPAWLELARQRQAEGSYGLGENRPFISEMEQEI